MPSPNGKHENYAAESRQRNKKNVALSVVYQDKPEETSWDKGKCYAELCDIA